VKQAELEPFSNCCRAKAGCRGSFSSRKRPSARTATLHRVLGKCCQYPRQSRGLDYV